ncbi:Nucleotide-binding protein, UspA family [Halalkaliarchaeum sp. AArc-CO]|uniref:universal stress protein n=1 Tax=unclassified Halalkaliarchaeum TaxID=2678344 RepID=UPI00217DB090|nr:MULTISPECIES: universal stress protein [unclassified Halalkaliarchaeum]MDR5674077.1 universal stress protein [Halalkaliarchaeum sp. AArc-GB]UWG50809.1 Nucleotide-binding protein, UspA family [Halalkaliarchaeum sp. AArc-CO]
MYDRILIPTDGSPAAEAAIEHAIDIAEKYDATVHALFVVDGAAYSTLEAGAEIVMEALESEGKRAVERIAEIADDAGLDCETSVVSGTAYRSIREYIDDHDIDLVVMGTHGRRGIDRYLLGSVTERVVRTSDVPVLTVRKPAE